MVSKRSLILALTVCTISVGCTSYGRSKNQVDVTEVGENETLSLLKQVNQLERENINFKNQIEIMQYELDQVNRRAQIQQVELDRLYQKEGLPGYTYSGNQMPPSATGTNQPTDTAPLTSQHGGYQTQQQGDSADPASQTGQYPVVTSAPEPSGQVTAALPPQQLYNSGYEQLKNGQYTESIQTFSTLLKQHPNSTYADDAQYWMGEAYYINRDFNNALWAFNQVVNVYSDGDRASDALLKTGYIYYEQGDVVNARNVFEDIIQKYPNERVADFARERLNNLGN